MRRADEKDTVGLALGAEHLGVGHLVAGLVDVVDRGRVAAFFNICLQFVQQIRKQGVLGALYHQGKALVGLLLQVLGVGIGLVAVLRHHGKDLFPCLGADAGVMVQHAGDGPHRVARLAGDILNGQKGLPSTSSPNSCGRKRGQTFSAVQMTDAANRLPISQESARPLP